jgi:hypothetical protein
MRRLPVNSGAIEKEKKVRKERRLAAAVLSDFGRSKPLGTSPQEKNRIHSQTGHLDALCNASSLYEPRCVTGFLDPWRAGTRNFPPSARCGQVCKHEWQEDAAEDPAWELGSPERPAKGAQTRVSSPLDAKRQFSIWLTARLRAWEWLRAA